MNTVQLETGRTLLLEEIDDRDRRVEIHEKCIEPYDANVRSLEDALRAGRMTQSEFEDRRLTNAWCSAKTVFNMVIDTKLVEIEFEKERRGSYIRRDPNLRKLRSTLERQLKDKLSMTLANVTLNCSSL